MYEGRQAGMESRTQTKGMERSEGRTRQRRHTGLRRKNLCADPQSRSKTYKNQNDNMKE